MRTQNGYRFTLQFPDDTELQRQVGEFLERLGSRKSRFIVMALGEYFAAHPVKLLPDSKIHLSISGCTKNDVRAMVREVLEENGGDSKRNSKAQPVDSSETNVDAMLAGLEAFG